MNQTKRCGRCKNFLPLDQFGVCRSRRDGLHVYCKPCNCAHISKYRAGARERKGMPPTPRRLRRAAQIADPAAIEARETAIAERVYELMKTSGSLTQPQIKKILDLTKDGTAEALRILMLDREVVGTRIAMVWNGREFVEKRVYYVRERRKAA